MKQNKLSPPSDSTSGSSSEPIAEPLNRLEIDPADIPPAERPRDPNVDDRTRVPEVVSPDDIPPVEQPKSKNKPGPK